MNLLGTPLLVMLAVLAIALPVCQFWFWTRVAGPKPVRTTVRIAMVIASQLATVMVIGVAVNRAGYFFTSWSDLYANLSFSSASNAPPREALAVHERLNLNPASAGRINVLTDTSFSTKTEWATRGRVQSVTIDGASTRLQSHAYVYFPPQYFQQKFLHHVFPASLVLAGYPSSDRALVNILNFPQVMSDQIANKAAQPMVLVMMRPSVAYPRDTQCTDVPAGPQTLTFFAQDIPSQMAQQFRVHRAGWGVIGYSEGGYCAAKIAMLYPSIFYAGASLSGYYHAIQTPNTGSLWGGSNTVRNSNDLEWRLKHLPVPPVSLLLTSSRQELDNTGYPDVKRFLKLVKSPLQVETVIAPTGGHNFKAWAVQLPNAIVWLAAKLPDAQPQ